MSHSKPSHAEKNRIYTADCVKFMKNRMERDSVDLTVTSPPYDNLRNYEGYDFDFKSVAESLYSVTRGGGGVVVWVIGDRINGGRSLASFEQALYFKKIGFTVHDVMIYRKKNTPFMRSNAYTNCYELMLILSKGKPRTFNPLTEPTVRSGIEGVVYNKGPDAVNRKVKAKLNERKTRTNIWEYAVGLGGTTSDRYAFEHPAVFPEKLAEEHILSWTNPGDLVFDPMCGSGTTCKMASAHGRKFLGCDVSSKYTGIARRRVGAIQRKMKACG